MADYGSGWGQSFFPRTRGVGPQPQGPVPQVAAPQRQSQDYDWNADIMRQLAEIEQLQKAPPMHTPERMQELRDANEREYQLGMLGILTGNDALKEAGGLVLKNALAQRQPKITERGVADQITGEFKYDPDYLRKSAQERLSLALQAKYQADERARQAERDDTTRKLLASQRNQTQITLKGMGGQEDGLSAGEARKFQQENALADDYVRDTKGPKGTLDNYHNLTKLAATPNAMTDMALVFGYMKVLDPTSVVKETEQASVQNAAGVPDQIRNLWNRVRTGERLNPVQREQLLGAAAGYASSAEKNLADATRMYTDRAKRRGLDPFQVTGVEQQRPPAAGGGGPAASGGGKPPPVRVTY